MEIPRRDLLYESFRYRGASGQRGERQWTMHLARSWPVEDINGCVSITVASKRRSTAELVSTNRKSLEEARAAKKSFADRYGLGWTQSFLGRVLQHSVAVAIVLLYSRNVLSATVRAFVSF